MAGLPNTELAEPWLTNWVEKLPTRIIINLMVEHDPCHTREINYISGLCHTHPTGESSCWIRRAETGE